MILGLAILTVLIGTLLPVQAGLNAELTKILNHPILGALISFFHRCSDSRGDDYIPQNSSR